MKKLERAVVVSGMVFVFLGGQLVFAQNESGASCHIYSFSAEHSQIPKGGLTKLLVNASGCTAASIDGGVGAIQLDGFGSGSAMTPSLQTTTNYTLTATDGRSIVTQTYAVQVSGGQPDTVLSLANPSQTPILTSTEGVLPKITLPEPSQIDLSSAINNFDLDAFLVKFMAVIKQMYLSIFNFGATGQGMY